MWTFSSKPFLLDYKNGAKVSKMAKQGLLEGFGVSEMIKQGLHNALEVSEMTKQGLHSVFVA